MKHVDTSKLSSDECWGIQIMGMTHCNNINCKFQGLTACMGQNIIRIGKNNKGFVIGPDGIEETSERERENKQSK